MKKAIAALALAFSLNTFAAEQHTFSNVQLDNLQFAYQFGEQFSKDGKFKNHKTRYDNSGLGYIMAALAWQESSAGLKHQNNKGHEAYGMFQNYLPTIRSRVDQIGWKMTDAQLIEMVKKRSNSASWAYIELSYWLNVHNGNMRKAIASYNAGWKWKAGNAYASHVLEKANYLKSNKMLEVVIE
ncbi:hypothetical protein KNT87_gp109 [Erwinia phage Cronus]|uniref:Transglycosylase SLT domain-containing protein n=1 Tax=Erwinia phage Cronus TaxID=2163633 RepID=A0A2S1GMD1_9CAUD|nr:hypothetical protein KNT87_gp109 [Erwinia phage Cronus]AWD90548.1 hypothetical protein [Erwinia phage Cronus]